MDQPHHLNVSSGSYFYWYFYAGVYPLLLADH